MKDINLVFVLVCIILAALLLLAATFKPALLIDLKALASFFLVCAIIIRLCKGLPAVLLPLALLPILFLSGCANGQYTGPSIGASVGYEGMSVGLTLYGKNPISLPAATPAPLLAKLEK